MNSLNFLTRLKSALKTPDVTTLPADQRVAVVQAINSALDDWSTAAPVALRTKPGAASFAAPVDIAALTCTANSNVISGGSLTAADVGKTLIIAGDPVPHVLTSATTLRLVYGGTTGSHTATLYGEAFSLPERFEGMAGPVWHEDASERRRIGLLPDMRRQRWFSGGASPVLGCPIAYGIETGNTLEGSGPQAIMRLYPIPATLQRLSFDWFGAPQPWTMTDLLKPRELDLSDTDWNSILPLVLANLLTTPGILAEGSNGSLIIQNAAQSLARVRNARPTRNNIPVTIGTPDNY